MKKIIIWLVIFAVLMAVSSCGEESTSESDYQFRTGDVTVTVNAEAGPILSALGAHLSYDESPSCAFEGLDKVYTYSGFEIHTYPMNGKDYVLAVYLNDDSVSTTEGIAVGASIEAVQAAYGERARLTGTSVICTGKTMQLVFLCRDGVVTNIQYQRIEK